jgi:hypothetical protein
MKGLDADIVCLNDNTAERAIQAGYAASARRI